MNHIRSLNCQCKVRPLILSTRYDSATTRITYSAQRSSHNRHNYYQQLCQHHFSTMLLLLLSESDVRRCLDMQQCIDVNRQALIALAAGDAIVPTRLALSYHPPTTGNITPSENNADDWTLFKPASLQAHTPISDDRTKSNLETVSMGMKVVSIRANNVSIGHPLVPATIVHIHPQSGIVDAIIAATYLTAVRTAAGSAIAIQHYFQRLQQLQQDDNNSCINTTNTVVPQRILRPRNVVVFGAGLQAEQHIRAIACIFQYCIPYVTIINRNVQRAELLRDLLLSEQLVETITIEPLNASSDNPHRIEETILLAADVIVTCTNAATPLWETTSVGNVAERWIDRKCIITGIGSYTPLMQEVPTNVVNACEQIWIDTTDATQVGDLKHLSSLSKSTDIHCATPQMLGSVLQRKPNGPSTTNDLGLVFYKAVGTAIQDILTADSIVERARKFGMGTNVDMT